MKSLLPVSHSDGFDRWRWICFIIMALGSFSGPLDMAEGVGEDTRHVARAPTLAIKLVAATGAGLVGIWGVSALPKARNYLTSMPGLCLCAIAIIFLATCLSSITPASLPIALVFIGYLLFMATALSLLELRGTVAAALLGCFGFTGLSLILYGLVPSIGVFVEEFDDGITVQRLGGLSQPNHTGRTALVGLLLATYFLRVRLLSRWWGWSLWCMFALAGLLAMSRTALLGGAVCLVLLNLDLLWSRIGALAMSASAVVFLGALFVLLATGGEEAFAQKLLGSITKTGDLEEVTQVTGRYDIWERTVRLIKGRPLQGYGLGSNKEMLKDHLRSTHNILLHPTLAAGIGAGGLTLILLLWNLGNVLVSPNLLIRALSAYVLISGLTEDTIYETFPGACTLLWIVCCLWPSQAYAAESSN